MWERACSRCRRCGQSANAECRLLSRAGSLPQGVWSVIRTGSATVPSARSRRRLISVSMCGAKSSITSCMINCAAARSSLSRCSRASGPLLAARRRLRRQGRVVSVRRLAGCADRIEQHRNLFLITVLDRVGQQGRLQVVIAEQLADRLEVVQQVRGLLLRFWSVHRNAQSRCKR